ncbi:hypothetical protein ACFLYW_04350 [Thermodesulfobacteriota bacterium]
MIKQTIKNILGTKNTQKVSQFRKAVRVSANRFFRDILSGKECLPALQTRIFDLPDAHVFFGYYDIPQFSRDENLLLAMAAPLINTTPSPEHHVRLGFFDLREDEPNFCEFAITSTWCWQQGCRLQWFPSEAEGTVLYNTIVDGSYGCIIQDVYSGEVVRSFRRPIYVVSRDGLWGLSLNFSRLQRLRPGYGYNVLPDLSQNELQPADDGIWRIDLEKGEEKLLVPLRDIAELKSDPTAFGAQHYFNHLLFNIDGDRFMFFHLWQLANGSRRIRLLTSNINGEDIRLLNDSGHASHYCWKDNNLLLCFSTITDKGEGYYLYNDFKGETQIIGDGILNEDGHPSFIPSSDWLITDTYPDKYGDQSLLLYDCDTSKLIVLDKEFSPVRFHTEMRCDLHPRVSTSGRYVCIDCFSDGKRAMKVFDISSLTNVTK